MAGTAGADGGERTRAGAFTSGSSTEPVDAASVLLVRGGDHDLEVLLLERHLDSDFAGGALVFPGGKVDQQDRELDASRWTGGAPSRWRERLGAASDADARGLLVAAIRETYEEAGVLLASAEDGSPLEPDALREPSFVEARRKLMARGKPWDWRRWLEDEALVLDLRKLAFFSWWVTPEGQHKRFDTRFFLARLPAGQSPAHDEVETTSLRWMRPADALAAHERGEVTIIFPTRRNLAQLGAFATADEAWEAACRDEVDQRRIQPKAVEVDGRIMVQHPYEDEPSEI